MDISPQAIASASFPVVKKGFDPDHVRSFLGEVGQALEAAQNQSTAMEARARAAVAKLQELTQATAKAPADQAAISSDDAEAISRTLLLAQKAADATIAEARQEADTMVSAARAEAATLIADARRQAAMHIEEARSEGRRASDAEKQRVESEVQALLARREFLVSDVDHLDEFVTVQRRRLQDVAAVLTEVTERGPGGLGEMRKPLLSAAADSGMDTIRPAARREPVAEDRWATADSDATTAETAVEVTSTSEVPAEVAATDDWFGADTSAADVDTSTGDADITGEIPTDDDLFIGDPVTAETPVVESATATAPALEGFEESEQTPPQSPALIDFDDLEPTTELPVVRRDR